MLHYLIGDATEPVDTQKPALICHVCNDKGRWGSGFVIAISKKDKRPEEMYLQWHKEGDKDLPLGSTQICSFTDGNYIANMIGQHDTRTINGVPPIRYEALERALKSVYHHAHENGMTVHMPRIGAVRSGGDWTKIEGIIKGTMGEIETYVYTLPHETDQWHQQYENEGTNEDRSNKTDS